MVSVLLNRYNHFEECLLRRVEWTHAGTQAALDWLLVREFKDGQFRVLGRPIEELPRVRMRLEWVVRSEMTSLPHPDMLSTPTSHLPWGMEEVAVVTTAPAVDCESNGYPTGTHILDVRWEMPRRMRIWFRSMEIVEL